MIRGLKHWKGNCTGIVYPFASLCLLVSPLYVQAHSDLSMEEAIQQLPESTVKGLVATTDTQGVQQTNGRTITGTVTDEGTDEPLIGVSVQLKGSKTGVITNLNGQFSIKVSGKNPQLIVSYIGYKTQTVDVSDLGVLQIKMQSANEQLGEVVVVGQGTQKKISVTGAITSIKGAQLKVPSSSLTSNLAGQLAGVISRVNTGEPGTSSEFYIRGINTFGGVATPLILLDGVEISTDDLNRLPAESIESFSILKDASATAIYGNRGANGVMLVTTKRGTENTKARVNVTAEVSYYRPVNRVEFVDGPTYMRGYNEAMQARSNTPLTENQLRYSEETIQNTINNVNPYVYPNVDWYNLIYKKANMNQRFNVNVQGGGSRVTYYMSLQANHDTGLLNPAKNYYYDNSINYWEYNFQNNISYKLTDKTTVELRMMSQIGNRKGPNYDTGSLYNQVMFANPVQFPAYFPNNGQYEELDPRTILFGSDEIKSGTYAQSPYAYLMSSYREINFNTLNTSLLLKQDFDFITKGLTGQVLVNFKNWSDARYQQNITPYYYRVKSGSYNAEDNTYALERLQNGTQFVAHDSNPTKSADQTFYLDARLDWKRTFGKHNLTAMAMYMMREYRSAVLPNRNQGYSGRATYDYDNRYLLEFNFGYNGSERLAKDDRFEFFPAASIGWVISQESFWQPLSKVVDFFKIRASYGLVGSDQFDGRANHFLFENDINPHTGWGSTLGLYDNLTYRNGPNNKVLAVTNAGWEHVKKLDIGVDMTLFNQVNITFDYFHDYRDRILMPRSSWPLMFGYWGSNPWSNIGEVLNTGAEFSIRWDKQINKDWYAGARVNFTYNQNKYKYVDEPDYPYKWKTLTGKPLNTLTGYVAEGLFESQEEIDAWPDQSQLGSGTLRPGDIKYRDINGDNKITTEDQVMLSPYNSVPRIQYGFGFNLAYRNFDFNVFFNGSAKRKFMINGGFSPFLADSGGETLPRNMMKWVWDEHWSVDNPNPDAKYPRLGISSVDVTNNNQPSSYWVRNARFIRFKTLEVGYKFKYGRVYLSGDNLAVFSPFKLWDPELWWNAYPFSRTFNLGLQLNF